MKEHFQDIVVPLLASPSNAKDKFRFIGSGFFVGSGGFLITCRHVAEELARGENLEAYQIGKRRSLGLKIIDKSERYDLALCKSINPPDIAESWPIVTKPYVGLASEVYLSGYVYEPVEDDIPFRERYMKGYITGIAREIIYKDSFELSFPVLFGMSGSPLLSRFRIEGDMEERIGIVGCAYGCHESSIVKHTVISTDNEIERVSRIVELGLAHESETLISILAGSDIILDVF